MKRGLKRLLKLADILDKADAEHRKHGEPTYCQDEYIHACGAPACAMGHWAAAHPKRWRFDRWGVPQLIHSKLPAQEHDQHEFGLTNEEADELFAGGRGCGSAQTAKQAAQYIRKFVKRKERETSANGDPK